MAEIAFCNIPMIAVKAEGLASRRFNLNEADVFKAGLLKPKSLATSASTNLN